MSTHRYMDGLLDQITARNQAVAEVVSEKNQELAELKD